MENFWTFNIGNVGTVISIVGILLGFHHANTKRIKDAAVELQIMKDDIKRFIAFENDLKSLAQLSARFDVIYPILMEAFKRGIFTHAKPED